MSKDSGGRARAHKDLQVCRQVYDALSYALAELDDPVIDELIIASVVPAPTASRVQVTLVPSKGDDFDYEDALARIHKIEARLRDEVAGEVHRKRVPVLVYQILHPSQIVVQMQ